MSNWIAQLQEDRVWHNRADYFPPPPLRLSMTRGSFIAAKWWRDHIDLYQSRFARALGDRP